jgi:hypothetical protein
MKNRSFLWIFALGALIAESQSAEEGADLRQTPAEQTQPSVAEYTSIQAALDANPGRVLWVPAGEYPLSEAIVVRHAGSGLCGPGRLIQSDADAALIVVRDAADVRLCDLTLTRPPERLESSESAVRAVDCNGLSLERLRVLDNRSAAAAIRLQRCRHAEVVRCLVRNYMTVSVDDRTASPHYGYAFYCIDGTAIAAFSCRDLLLQANRILEENLRPTRQTKDRHQLGRFSKRAPTKGSLISRETWEAGYVNNWHQGSAILVTGPEETAYVRVLDNHVENAAQGIDVHADHVTISGNFVVNSFMGMKAMHGSRHVLIAGNQFIRNDLWSIGLMPGAASHGPVPGSGQSPPRAANVDGGSVIANNIISQFGHGDSHWIWDPAKHTCAPIVLDRGQEADDPPLCGVVVTGNVVYGPEQQRAEAEGLAQPELPRYRFVVYVSPAADGPRGLLFSNNLFQPGTEGISNVAYAEGTLYRGD